MRIEKLKLKDVGPFKDLDLDLGAAPSGGKAEVVILTGPNGCGKSTILYALAQLVSPRQAPDLLGRRLRGPGSLAAIRTDQGDVWLRPRSEGLAPSAAPWADSPFPRETLSGRLQLTLSGVHREERDLPAFAYGAGRTLEEYRLESVKAPEGEPLQGSLGFESRMGQRLAEWVLATRAKEALARSSGDQTAALRYAEVLSRIEEIVGGATGQPTRLLASHEPLDVVLERRGQRVSLDLLPDGLKSILTWVGDLVLRLGRVPWTDSRSLTERPFLLLLDEVEVHLHPAWQRQVLPLIQRLFTNAQVIVSTHSPFVVSSCPGAKVVCLQVDEQDGSASLRQVHTVGQGESYTAILESVFGFDEPFDPGTQAQLERFYAVRDDVLRGQRPLAELKALAQPLLGLGVEVRDIVALELRQAERRAAASSAP